MTLISVVREVCAPVGVTAPTSVFSNITSNRTMQEMLALANEMAQRIAADTRNWTALKQMATLVGDGVTTAFDFPADYLRLPITSNVWLSSSTQAPMRFFPDTDEWAKRRAAGTADGRGEWTILRKQMHIFPVMPVGVSATFIYMSKNAVALAAGGFGDAFITDNDTFVLDERLLKLGMIWQWKANKGSPYAEDMGTYSDALMTAMGFDSPAPIIIGRLPMSATIEVANQGQVP